MGKLKLEFTDWVSCEMKRAGINRTTLAKVGGISSGYVSRVLNKESKPGIGFCKAVAKALSIPEQEVLYRSGISDEKPMVIDHPLLLEIIEEARQLSPLQREAALALIKLVKSGELVVEKS